MVKPLVVGVFDTETSGKPVDFKALPGADGGWPRLCSISCMVYDFAPSERSVDKSNAYTGYVKPDGWEVEAGASAVNGLTTEMLEKGGLPVTVVVYKVVELLRGVDILVGHNLQFDLNVLVSELLRLSWDEKAWNLLRIPTYDTMLKGTDVCKLPGKYGGYKWPTLTELYGHLFGQSQMPFASHRQPFHAHDAKVDAQVTANCFFELFCSHNSTVVPVNEKRLTLIREKHYAASDKCLEMGLF